MSDEASSDFLTSFREMSAKLDAEGAPDPGAEAEPAAPPEGQSVTEAVAEAEAEGAAKEDGEPKESKPEKPEQDDSKKTKGTVAKEDTGDGSGLTVEQLQKAAKNLGYSIDDQGKLTMDERRRFREERKKNTAWVNERKAEIEKQQEDLKAELEAEKAKIAEQGSKFSKLEELSEAGDLDGVAQLLGKKDYEDLQAQWLAQYRSPEYKRLKALEKRAQEREEQEQKAQEEREKREADEKAEAEKKATAEEREKSISTYKVQLGEKMTSSADKELAALADDPMLVNTIFAIQSANYDRETGSTVTPEQAFKMPPPGGKRPVRDELISLRDRLNKAFGTTSETAPKTAKSNGKSAPAGTSPPEGGSRDEFDEEAWRKRFHEQLNRAAEIDRRAEVKG